MNGPEIHICDSSVGSFAYEKACTLGLEARVEVSPLELTGSPQPNPVKSELLIFLIADVRGYTRFTVEHGDEAAAALAARFAHIATEVAAVHSGRVTELRGDEALAVFASARNAVRAAIELQARLHTDSSVERPLKVGIGIDAGEVIPVMGGYRGGALNLAARLCNLAGPGEILASQGVVHLARRVEGVTYSERGAVQLKGFAEQVAVFDVLPATSDLVPTHASAEHLAKLPAPILPVGGFLGALPENSLVARTDELARLRAIGESVMQREGRVVLMNGEPGVGKTRLAQEMTLWLRDSGFAIGAGRCYASRDGVAFYPFLDLLSALYASSSVAIRELVSAKWSYLAKLVPEMSPATTLSSESSEEQDRLFRAVTGFVVAVATERPVALLLDDLHWADETSLDLMLHLSRGTRAHRVLLVATYRDSEVTHGHPLDAAVMELTRERLADRMKLPRLSAIETVELVGTLLGRSDMPPELGEALYNRTDGNAFFIQETIREVVDGGLLDADDAVATLAQLSVPESVRSLVAQRVGRASEQAQRLLGDASVLGQQFTFDDLLSLMQNPDEVSEEDVDTLLQEVARIGLLRETGKDTYAFQHALIQQALYQELAPRRRRRLHGMAGEALERMRARSRREEVPAAVLVHHFEEASNSERTLHWALIAGDQARSVFAHAEAERYYRLAKQRAEELDNREREIDALEKLGDVLEAAARYEEALDAFDSALALLDLRQNLDRVRGLTARASGTCFYLGRTEEGLSRITQLLQGDAEETPSLGLLYSHLGLAHMYTGNLEEMRRAGERGGLIARRFNDRRTLAFAEQWRGYGIGGTEGIVIEEEAMRLAEQVGDGFLVRTSLVQTSDLYEQIGDLPAAGECFRRAISVTETMGEPDWLAFLYAWQGRNFSLRGKWEEAHERAQLARQIAPSGLEGFMAPYPLAILGEILLAAGTVAEGRQLLEESITIAEKNHDAQALCLALPALAEYALLQDRPEDATSILEPHIDAVRPSFFGDFCTSRLAIAFARTGRVDEADRLLSVALNGQGRRTNRTALSGLWRAIAVVRSAQGRRQDATTAFDSAVGVAEEVGYPLANALALLDHGRAAIVYWDMQISTTLVRGALSIFEEVHAVPYAERAYRLLSDSS